VGLTKLNRKMFHGTKCYTADNWVNLLLVCSAERETGRCQQRTYFEYFGNNMFLRKAQLTPTSLPSGLINWFKIDSPSWISYHCQKVKRIKMKRNKKACKYFLWRLHAVGCIQCTINLVGMTYMKGL
jgi:hypothetical protein